MAKDLVIVESPAKAKTFQKYLGKNYEVHACMGHVRDLPKTKFGIDVEHHFTPKYTLIPAKVNLVKQLSQLAEKSNRVYLATDLDREGEAIAWHLTEAMKISPERTSRITFNEITQSAIQNAFQSPSQIKINKVYAQQARRVLDRIVGYLLSPLLWKKFTRGLSAGRVQSVAVKLVVEKEKEIQAFKSEEYWKIMASLYKLSNPEKAFESELKKEKNKKIKIPDEKTAKAILAELAKHEFVVADISRKEKQEKPYPPFATSQLQQQASIQLGFRTKHTMSIAQQLYEGIELGLEGPVGLITYMRTDSFHVSLEAIKECRMFIGQNYPGQYLPPNAPVYSNKKAQEAHEAIRPTSVFNTPEKIKEFLSRDQYKLYKLIWTRFVASQMAPAIISITTILTQAGNFLFESKGKEIVFPGYLRLTANKQETEEGEESIDEKMLPEVQKDEKLGVSSLNPSQHFTQPSPRYTEATLVKALETNGIGRPSTYAPIITTIQERGYVKLEDRKFFATELGIKVTEQLNEFFPDIMDTKFTSGMETKLDDIEENKMEWTKVVEEFYSMFSHDLENADKNMQSIKQNPEVSSYTCEQCGSPMIYKYNKKGKFLGCSNFPNCKSTLSLDEHGNPIFFEKTDHLCSKCGSPMIIRTSRSGKFLGCSKYPDCKNAIPVDNEGNPIPPEETGEVCPTCSAPMLKRQGPHGPFLACSRYPDCQTTASLGKKQDLSKLIQLSCPKCNRPMTLKKGPRGIFLGCTGYPECKNIQRFSLDCVKFPESFHPPVCGVCGQVLLLKYSKKGLFWGCPEYPNCNFTAPCDLQEIANSLKE